jgi:hypothetical protein
MAYTLDNASSNNTFTEYIINNDSLNNGYFNESVHIRCFAHCLNLSVDSIFNEIKESIDKERDLVKTINNSAIKKSILKSIVE